MVSEATAKKKSTGGCECLPLVQEELKKQGCKLTTCLSMNFKTGKASVDGPFLQVEKLEPKSRVRLVTLMPTYCPFCGVKQRGDE